MSQFKILMKGSLEFGNQKSYDLMLAHFQKRLESYYKNDLLFKDPSLFSPDTLSIVVPRIHVLASEKTWKNTFFMLRELRSFAVAGELDLWVTDENSQLCASETFLPQGDKVATSEYLRGVRIMEEKGDEDIAIECFNKAIDKYPRYSQAYERRGFAYYRLGRFEDALIDFSKSLNLYKNPYAYFGMAVVKVAMKDIAGALADFQTAIDNATPYQAIFWKARRVKGETHLRANDIEKAIFELKLVSKRAFKETDPNYAYRKQAWQKYGEALLKKGDNAEACRAFQEALAIEECSIVEDLLRSIKIEAPSAKPAVAIRRPKPVLN